MGRLVSVNVGMPRDIAWPQERGTAETQIHSELFGPGASVTPGIKPVSRPLPTSPSAHVDQDTSVAKAKQAISSYRKSVGDPAGLAELMVFYCERAAGFCDDLRGQDEGYFDALVRAQESYL